MKMSNVSAGRFLIDRGTDAKRASRTSWGEESYIKVSSTLSNSAYSILDYRAPAGFGVVRHLHHREDEAPPRRGSDRGLDAGSLPNADAGRPHISAERS